MPKFKILDFHAAWCGPCKIMGPHIESLIKKYNVEGSNVEIVKVDIEAEPVLAEQYNVKSIPTLVFLKDDVEFLRRIGFQPKNRLFDLINESVKSN